MNPDTDTRSSDVWEPWQPQVGQRVRIILNAECPGAYDWWAYGLEMKGAFPWSSHTYWTRGARRAHKESDHDRHGTVALVEPAPNPTYPREVPDGHRYTVRLDPRPGDQHADIRRFAAGELIALDEPLDHERTVAFIYTEAVARSRRAAAPDWSHHEGDDHGSR